MDQTRTAAALGARYGMPAAQAAVRHLNPVLEQLLAHRSVRAYRPDPVPPGTLEALVAAAQSASTSSNLQVWSVVAVEEGARKDRLAKLAGDQAHIRQAPLFLVWLADLWRLDGCAGQRGTRAEGLDYLEGLLLGVIDAALAAQNAAVALESMGLSCVYIGAIRNQVEQVARELALPPHVFPVFGMCVGYADPARPAAVKPRLAQRAVLHRERYDREAQAPAVAEYDQVMDRFYAEQAMPNESWSGTSVKRVQAASALRGREHLVAALHNLGFVLR